MTFALRTYRKRGYHSLLPLCRECHCGGNSSQWSRNYESTLLPRQWPHRLTRRQYQQGYYLQNGHGDVVELRDNTGVMSLNPIHLRHVGHPLTTNEAVENPFRYSGELWDKPTSLQYLRARWYDPSVDRFINEDTYEGQIDNPLSLNRYTYVHNNPLIATDPTGHMGQKANNVNGGVPSSHEQVQAVVVFLLIEPWAPMSPGTIGRGAYQTGKGIWNAVKSLGKLFSKDTQKIIIKDSAQFEGTLYRSVKEGDNPLEIHQGNIKESHRYTGKGTGGLYFGTGEKIVDAELNHWAVATGGRAMHAFDVKIGGLLDVSNESVRKSLGVTLADITGNDYAITQKIGQYALNNGYTGIVAPSARADGGLNVVLFSSP